MKRESLCFLFFFSILHPRVINLPIKSPLDIYWKFISGEGCANPPLQQNVQSLFLAFLFVIQSHSRAKIPISIETLFVCRLALNQINDL